MAPTCTNKGLEMFFFYDVELIYGGDKFQVCLKYTKLLKFNDTPQIPVYDNSHSFVLDLGLYIEDRTNLLVLFVS